MIDAGRVVAIGLLSERDLELLGSGFERAYPVEELPAFVRELLPKIDAAERAMLRPKSDPD